MKLQKYNQWLLAIAGTVGLLFLIGVVLFSIADSLRWRYDYESDYTEPISSEATEDLLKDSLRSQIISFNDMILVDSATKTYMLPVSQADLEAEETIDNEGLLGLTNSTGYRKSVKYYDSQTYNNIIIYSANGESKVLFKEKVGLEIKSRITVNTQKYIFFLVANKDTNDDKKLNSDDLQELYVYNIMKGILQKINKEKSMVILDISYDYKTELVTIKYGVDRNRNGDFEYTYEPKSYKILDMETMTFKAIIPSAQIEELQQILEGS